MNLYGVLCTVLVILCAGCNESGIGDVHASTVTAAVPSPSPLPTEVGYPALSVAVTRATTVPSPSPIPTEVAHPAVPVQEKTATAQPLYVSEDFGFHFAVPDGYVVQEYEHPDALLVVSLYEAAILADERIHKPEIFVTIHKNQENLHVEKWFEAHTAETLTHDMYPIYVGPRNLQTTRIAGRAALSFEDMTFSHAYVTLVEGDDYILATGYVPFDYPGLAEDFERVLDSLSFRD